jgi:hypothetical protein
MAGLAPSDLAKEWTGVSDRPRSRLRAPVTWVFDNAS